MALKGIWNSLADLYNKFGEAGVPPRNSDIRDLIASVSQLDVQDQGSSTAGTSTLTLTAGNVLVRANAASGDIDVVLPPAANVPGQLILVKRLDAVTTTDVTLVYPAIDGATDSTVDGQHDLTGVMSNGTSYDIVALIVN